AVLALITPSGRRGDPGVQCQPYRANTAAATAGSVGRGCDPDMVRLPCSISYARSLDASWKIVPMADGSKLCATAQRSCVSASQGIYREDAEPMMSRQQWDSSDMTSTERSLRQAPGCRAAATPLPMIPAISLGKCHQKQAIERLGGKTELSGRNDTQEEQALPPWFPAVVVPRHGLTVSCKPRFSAPIKGADTIGDSGLTRHSASNRYAHAAGSSCPGSAGLCFREK